MAGQHNRLESDFPMRIISLNANGIRAAARKGFFEWFAQQDSLT